MEDDIEVNFQQVMSESQKWFYQKTCRINVMRIKREKRAIAGQHAAAEKLDKHMFDLQSCQQLGYIIAAMRYLAYYHIQLVENYVDDDSYLIIVAELYYHILRTRSDVSLAALLSMDKEALKTAASIGVHITCEYTYVFDVDRFWLFDKDWTK